MAEHVQTRSIEELAGDAVRPRLRWALEVRDRPGPAYKQGVFSDDTVWIQMRGGLFVARATVKIAWRGEFSRLDEIKQRCPSIGVSESFWSGRPRHGYAIVAQLEHERWVDPFWAGPRTYGYEWITLENDSKRKSWLEPKDPPRGGDDLLRAFERARAAGFPR